MDIGLSAEVASALGAKPTGSEVKWIIACRTLIQLYAHMKDGLSRQAIPILERYAPEFVGETFLDVGCYGGWLYPHLARVRPDLIYHGLDNWPDAIEAARMCFPAASFDCGDAVEMVAPYDTIWCSHMVDKTWPKVLERCIQLSRLCVFATPPLDQNVCQRLADHHGRTMEWNDGFPPNRVAVFRRIES